MMKTSFLPPSHLVLLLFIGSITLVSTGCEFLGFSSDGPVTVVENDSDNADNQDTDESGIVVLFDEKVDIIDSYSDPITVDVPDNVQSMSISVTEGNESLMWGVTHWHDEEDFAILPDGWESGSAQICFQNCNNRVALQPGAFGALAPNNPDSQVIPGEHQFQVFSAQVSSPFLELPSTQQAVPQVRVTVHARLADDEVSEEGKLDVNVFFSGANDWTADSAQNDEEFQALIDEMDEIYDQVGVEIGEISYNDVDTSYQVIEDVMSGTGDLSEMFAESQDAPLDGPSIFFVSELRSPLGGGGILGIAGGIPGPVLVDGSNRSGVAIATDSIDQPGAPSMAHVVAHELGHYLGLFHTTENFAFGGTPEHDPLPDTPENDTSLLMHASGSGNTLSEWQGIVMRNNPWVRQ